MLCENDPLLVEAIEVFTEAGFKILPKLGASMIWVNHPESRHRYSFYPTTGRWGVYGGQRKHYSCKSPQDFINRFVMPEILAARKSAQAETNIDAVCPEHTKCSLDEFIDFICEKLEDGVPADKLKKQILRDFANE